MLDTLHSGVVLLFLQKFLGFVDGCLFVSLLRFGALSLILLSETCGVLFLEAHLVLVQSLIAFLELVVETFGFLVFGGLRSLVFLFDHFQVFLVLEVFQSLHMLFSSQLIFKLF